MCRHVTVQFTVSEHKNVL